MGRVFVEDVDVRPNDVVNRHRQMVGELLERLLHGWVDVVDDAVAVGDHDVGRGVPNDVPRPRRLVGACLSVADVVERHDVAELFAVRRVQPVRVAGQRGAAEAESRLARQGLRVVEDRLDGGGISMEPVDRATDGVRDADSELLDHVRLELGDCLDGLLVRVDEVEVHVRHDDGSPHVVERVASLVEGCFLACACGRVVRGHVAERAELVFLCAFVSHCPSRVSVGARAR